MDFTEFLKQFGVSPDKIIHSGLPPVEAGLERLFGKVVNPDASWTQRKQPRILGDGQLPSVIRLKLSTPLPARPELKKILTDTRGMATGRVAFQIEGLPKGHPMGVALPNAWQKADAALRQQGAPMATVLECLCETAILIQHFQPGQDMTYWTRFQESRFGEALTLEFMNQAGVSNRASAATAHLRACLRDDFGNLTRETNPGAETDMKRVLLSMPRPQYLFDLDRLQKLFFEELLPMQIVARTNCEPIVNAAQLVTLGLP